MRRWKKKTKHHTNITAKPHKNTPITTTIHRRCYTEDSPHYITLEISAACALRGVGIVLSQHRPPCRRLGWGSLREFSYLALLREAFKLQEGRVSWKGEKKGGRRKGRHREGRTGKKVRRQREVKDEDGMRQDGGGTWEEENRDGRSEVRQGKERGEKRNSGRKVRWQRAGK